MSNEQGHEGRLVTSIHRGRYALALDDPEQGPEIASGASLAILLGGQWIEGRVEHGGSGYFFQARDGGICGLCPGMQVRLH